MSAYLPCQITAATIRALHEGEITEQQALQILGVLEYNEPDELEDCTLKTHAFANRFYGVLSDAYQVFYYGPNGRHTAEPPAELARMLQLETP